MNDDDIKRIVLAKPEPTKTAKEIARALVKALRKASAAPETGEMVAKARANRGVVTITVPAKEKR